MSFTITPNLFAGDSPTVTVVKCNDGALERRHFRDLLKGSNRVLGVATTFGKHCKLSSIAFSTPSQVLLVRLSAAHGPHQAKSGTSSKWRHVARGRSLIQDHLLLNPDVTKYAFRMDQLAVSLYLDMSIRVSDAVDMLSVSIAPDRHSLEALMDAMGGETLLHKENVRSLFFGTSKSSTLDVASQVALRAWAACWAASLSGMLSPFDSIPRINTVAFPKAFMVAIASISRHADRSEASKPLSIKNDVMDHFDAKKGAIDLRCDRFSTRIRKSSNQVIRIEIQDEGTTRQVIGRADKVKGRRACIKIDGSVRGDKILSVTTIGKGVLTFAESEREAVILATLQHKSSILSNPFFLSIWLPNEKCVWPKCKTQKEPPPVHFDKPLNSSQRKAVQRMLSNKDDNRIVMIQGPPGTGKTTVIAGAVISYRRAGSSRNIWVAAQSNVAVKNIAEKFVKENFLGFTLLVSKDFHFDWHEHLYEELEPRLIRSDRFENMSIVVASRILLDCKVILCTLSMLSNPFIDVFLKIVPVEMVIFDEASQIECGNYLPLLHRFQSTLSKLVFIGDDKQLPPYGQEDIPELRSVFEFPHLRRRALFLDTQYRMPRIIGTFISQKVYGNKLLTEHNITSLQACLFVDVNKGQEDKMGCSWTNREEARIVVKLARSYISKNKVFRIITPYDAQRSLIENYLKSEKLPWEDKVFNVDSFQGNEAENIIISVVRSNRPGFLKNQRRTNVMLTRCKESMVICSSRTFLFTKASETLLGELAVFLGQANWVDGNDVAQGLL